ncbi:MAG: hypothetical protein PHS60_06810 [Zavarzinia sp.]|nr:hypothetical protein [Zavarzinia sp.]
MTDLARIRLPDHPLAIRPAEAIADRLPIRGSTAAGWCCAN